MNYYATELTKQLNVRGMQSAFAVCVH